MHNYQILIGNKIIANVFTFVDIDRNVDTKEYFVNVIDDLPKFSDIGYLGFKTKLKMEEHLAWAMFGNKFTMRLHMYSPSVENESMKIIDDTLKKCVRNAKPSGKVKMFLFPTIDPFVKEKMLGATGFCIWKNAIALYIQPKSGKWKTGLRNSLCHEYAHSLTNKYSDVKTLLDGMIHEGVAECFREFTLNQKPSSWSTALNEKQAKNLLSKMKKSLNSKDGKLYRDVFFGSRKYPKFAGYSIGHYVVRNYIKRTGKPNWSKIFKKSPKEILEKSKFLVP